MKRLLQTFFAVIAVLVASVTYTCAADVYVTTLQDEDGPMHVYIDDQSIARIQGNNYVFDYAYVYERTGESTRLKGAVGSFYSPYDVFYLDGEPYFVSKMKPLGQKMAYALIEYLRTHRATISY